MTDPTIEHLTRLLMNVTGEAHANGLIIEALIATHPDPEALRNVWHRSKPLWIDGLEDRNVFKSEDFMTGALQRMSAVSQAIDASELLTRPGTPD